MRIHDTQSDTLSRKLASDESVAFDAWKASKPIPPDTDRPLHERPDHSLAVGLTLLLVIIAATIGSGICIIAGITQSVQAMVNGFLVASVVPALLLAMGHAFRLLSDAIYDKQYACQLVRHGWTKYDAALKAWRDAGTQQFSELTEMIELVEEYSSVYGSHDDLEVVRAR